MDAQKALSQFGDNKRAHLEDLKNLVRIPSVSFPGFSPEEVRRSARAVFDLLKTSGLENVEILELEPGVHPYVYGDWLRAPGKPTLLLYAHHDVQPPGREALWKSPPFDPAERDGRLFGRGTADDKAGIVVHTAAIASWLKACGKLPLNVKLVIEGEEEIGSTHLALFLSKYSKKLQADAMILTDTQNYDIGLPALTVSLRGLVSFDLEVRALRSPKHSGMWGGPTPDATMALAKILSSMVDEQGRVCIPGIWDEVRPVTGSEARAYAELSFSIPEFRAQAGFLRDTHATPARDGTVKPLIQMWREPSLAVNAIEASSRKQAANSIMDSAWARFGIRLAPDMDPKRTAKLVEEHVRRVAPWGIEVGLHTHDGVGAWGIVASGPAFEAAMQALELGYGRKPVLMGCGGTIPFVEPFAKALGGAPALLIGVEDPYTNAHSENESMVIADFYSCIKSAIHFYALFAEAHRA
ncbi:MAG: M20/M25/M40 family metallo-hydrolase [Deltaproteobacteria bacterium]|nr:M20/M25/M40 family metallo-hydrolase [Deltaproteobacteria bacterium]